MPTDPSKTESSSKPTTSQRRERSTRLANARLKRLGLVEARHQDRELHGRVGGLLSVHTPSIPIRQRHRQRCNTR